MTVAVCSLCVNVFGESSNLTPEGEWQFRTKLAEPYPPTMALQYARLMVLALELRRIARRDGLPMPRAPREHDAYMKHLGFDGNVVPWCECPDPVTPWVRAPRGMSELEHVAWARSQRHVMSNYLNRLL